MTYRDSFTEMLASIKVPYDDCKEYLAKSASYCRMDSSAACSLSADIGLDKGFKSFYNWCKSESVPVVIVSR